jgi:hypothetical protein
MTLRPSALATLPLIGTTSPARADATIYTLLAEAGRGNLIRRDALNAGAKRVDLKAG